MKLLFLGDIVGRLGRDAVADVLPEILENNPVDYVIANCENLAHGRGATKDTILEMQALGINYFTSGDHVFWHLGFEDIIDNLPVLRPENYPIITPGKGYQLITINQKSKLLLINLMGRTNLNEKIRDPFTVFDDIFTSYAQETNLTTIVDFHAEATSEKMAFGFYVDGRATAVLGTHTHIPSCDNMILPKGTLYITDVGMTGSIDSVLGVKKEIIINSYLTARNQKFDWEESGRKAFRSVLLDTVEKTIIRLDKVI